MSKHWSLTVSPAKMPETTHNVMAINTGQERLQLSVYAAEVHKVNGQCTVTSARPSWAKVTPAALSLAPGQKGHAHVKILRQPAHPTDLAIVFRTRPPQHGVGVSESVAAQMAVGHASCGALSAPHSPSSPMPLAAGGLGAFVVLVATVALARRYMRRTPRARGAHR